MVKKNELWQQEFAQFFDCYPFTHETAFRLKDLLILNFNEEQVRQFIEELRDCCEGAACLLAQPDFKTYKNDRKSIVNTLGKCERLLDDLRKGRALKHLSSFESLYEYNETDVYLECQEIAVTTLNLLRMLIRKIKQLDDSNILRFRGRSTADSKGIVLEIKQIWEKYFHQTPTDYADGLFMEVVQIVLEGLNLPCKDPRRKIKEAIKS